MLIGHLFIGIVLGVVAALASLLMGFSVWEALGIYSAAGVLGTVLSAVVVMLRKPRRAPLVTSELPEGYQEHQSA